MGFGVVYNSSQSDQYSFAVQGPMNLQLRKQRKNCANSFFSIPILRFSIIVTKVRFSIDQLGIIKILPDIFI
jgi:hypothetical protein